MNVDEELKLILETDPLGVLALKPKASSAISADERLIASFEEINSFMTRHGREPTASDDISERKLYSRLKGLRESVEKAEMLRGYDKFGLLAGVKAPDLQAIKTIDDIFQDDALGLLSEPNADIEADNSIFTLKNVPRSTRLPDHVATRKPCKEFARFEPLFKQAQAELHSKKKVLVPFRSERQIEPERLFILQGVMVWVAARGKWEKKNFGNVNARLYCVFENGTESNMLLRSLAAALWKDENSRQVIEADQRELFSEGVAIDGEDKETGFIYVLRSLSDDPNINNLTDLYKIGFSSTPIQQRIQNARQEATYLFADVVPVVEFKTYNLNPQKLELLLHTFFAGACLNLDVFGSEGKRYVPREWFVVPLHVIETAIELLINGEIVNYRYDCEQQAIVER